jgi:hypothetical protein
LGEVAFRDRRSIPAAHLAGKADGGVFPCLRGDKRIGFAIMIVGHLAIASIAKRKFLAENFIFLVVASYGPDLVDKPASLVFQVSGRGAGHSLLLFALLAAAAWLYCQRFKVNKQLVWIGSVLWLSHLTVDVVDLKIFLWPFFGPFPVYPPYPYLQRLRDYYLLLHHPVQLAAEISLIIIAMALWSPYSLRTRLRFLAPLIRVDSR